MDTAVALAELGVHPAAAAITEALDRDGFVAIPDALSAAQLTAIRDRIAALAVAEGDRAGLEVHQEQGSARLADLVNKGEMFDVFYTHPLVLAGVAHVLGGDVKMSSLNSRAALPGQGHQGLHADWGVSDLSDTGLDAGYQVCNSIWLLDDFTPDNGATRAVPGSHRSGTTPAEVMDDPAADHPDQVLLLAPAGTAVIFNSHLWHGGTVNRTDEPRRAVHCYFSRRQHPQQLDQRAYLRPETQARLSPAVAYLLDVD